MGTQPGLYATTVDTGTQTFAQFTNLIAGVTYYFMVQAYDAALNLSDPSPEVSGAAPTTSPLTILCPAPTATSSNGAAVAVTFSPTTSGGVAPVNASCSPASGSLFPVGSTAVTCSARDSVGATASCSTTVVVTTTATTSPTPTPAPSTTTTQVDITGAVAGLSGRCPGITFTVNGTRVATTSATTYSRGSCSSLSNGKQVEVVGATDASGRVSAQSVSVIH